MHVKVSKMYCSQRACHVDRVHWHMSSAALSDTTFHNSRQLRVAQLSLNLIGVFCTLCLLNHTAHPATQLFAISGRPIWRYS